MRTIQTLIDDGFAIRGVIVRTPRGSLACVQGCNNSQPPLVEVDGGGYFDANQLEVVGAPGVSALATSYVEALALIRTHGIDKVREAHDRCEDECIDDMKCWEVREMLRTWSYSGRKGIAQMDVYELATEIATKYEGENVEIIMEGK